MIRFILIGTGKMVKIPPDHPAIEWSVDDIEGGNPITASIANSYGRIDSSSLFLDYFRFVHIFRFKQLSSNCIAESVR